MFNIPQTRQDLDLTDSLMRRLMSLDPLLFRLFLFQKLVRYDLMLFYFIFVFHSHVCKAVATALL